MPNVVSAEQWQAAREELLAYRTLLPYSGGEDEA
jgi:hypothetical protein